MLVFTLWVDWTMCGSEYVRHHFEDEWISLHFLIFSPFHLHFLILSPFPLDFLFLSPFSRSQAARLPQFVQPCIKVCTCQCSTTHFRVVVKADIEGAELKIIPDMVRRNAFNKLRRAAQKDKFLVIVFNKESADVLTLRIFQVWPWASSWEFRQKQTQNIFY